MTAKTETIRHGKNGIIRRELITLLNRDATRGVENRNPRTVEEKHEQLKIAFEMVQDVDDWRAPISVLVRDELVTVCSDAIEYFTATRATVTDVDAKPGFKHLAAVGYRNGPAGS